MENLQPFKFSRNGCQNFFFQNFLIDESMENKKEHNLNANNKVAILIEFNQLQWAGLMGVTY